LFVTIAILKPEKTPCKQIRSVLEWDDKHRA